jgi:hypothetical protein
MDVVTPRHAAARWCTREHGGPPALAALPAGKPGPPLAEPTGMRTAAPWILLAACLAAPACDDPTTSDAPPDAGVASADAANPMPDGAVAVADAGTGADASPDADPSPDADLSPDALPEVPSSGTWFVEAAPVAGGTESAVVSGGELVLTAEGHHSTECTSVLARCVSIDTFQRGLRGDFDVSLDVASFSGPEGAAVFLFVEVEGQLTHDDIGSSAPRTLRMHREDDRLVMSTRDAGGEDQVVFEGYRPGELRVGIALAQGGTSGRAEAHLAAFDITGGGGQVKADAFDEDAVLLP